ncbi:V-snare-domain-containing protein [Dissoconium aciculare CBS 342.82]|uniref:Golgi SNAP receptor complex member 1 n=1 Tax=Dissoconium aciculare CBS 342.82 TaxID=1314786 RepID=A0A6J3LYS1_9PEZI|nr:V-snare-domain-containing protein [Dissoconium aciculare CBS 342.82]KAF1820906.1 V-snare-domain-containing protein [Dissoconium aciculare CBS 342.82]
MAATASNWAQLRQQARAQETQTESLFHTYSQFASKADLSSKSSDEEQHVEKELNDILEKRSSLLAQLARVLDSETTPSALKSTNLARHREILGQHRTEFSRLKAQIAHTRDRANLLSNVRSDIKAYRSANPEAAEAEYMLDERSRLDNSHNVVDSVLSQAYAVNESFGLQRESLLNIQRRITGAAAQIPGINGLMQRIGSKKRRDGIILGAFIGILFLLFLWLW